MTGRAGRERRVQKTGRGHLRAGSLVIAAASILTTGALLAANQRSAEADAAVADAVVAKLRNLPMPLRAFPRGIAPAKATPPPLPALESRRQKVYDELHALGRTSVPALARALRDPDPEMRRAAAVALDVLGGGWWHFPDGGPKLDLRPALPALVAALRDSDPDVRAWGAQDIGDMGGAAAAAVPPLRAMLHSADAGSRSTACSALGGIGRAARDALPDLRNALNDASPEVREAARRAIASVDPSSSRLDFRRPESPDSG